VVSGLPASGKTTLAVKLAQALGLPLFDKDDILEALFEGVGPVDPAERQRLSRASDEVLARISAASQGAVIVSFWRHESAGGMSGTPVAWLKALSASLVEVHCVCSPEVAEQRFRARRRHPSHNDDAKAPGLAAKFRQLAELGPLGLGATIQAPTNGPSDLGGLVDEVRRRLG
jgi:predicted kinase